MPVNQLVRRLMGQFFTIASALALPMPGSASSSVAVAWLMSTIAAGVCAVLAADGARAAGLIDGAAGDVGVDCIVCAMAGMARQTAMRAAARFMFALL